MPKRIVSNFRPAPKTIELASRQQLLDERDDLQHQNDMADGWSTALAVRAERIVCINAALRGGNYVGPTPKTKKRHDQPHSAAGIILIIIFAIVIYVILGLVWATS